MRHIFSCVPCIYNSLYILFSQTVLVTVLHESVLGINKEYSLAVGCAGFVQYDYGCRNTCTEEYIGWEAYYPLYIASLDDMLSDCSLRISPEQHSMRQNTCAATCSGLHGCNQMQQKGIVTTFGRWAHILAPTVVLYIIFSGISNPVSS